MLWECAEFSFLVVMSLVAFGSSIAQSAKEKAPVDLRGVWQMWFLSF